jgi:uncharacterized protein (DUF488 family)
MSKIVKRIFTVGYERMRGEQLITLLSRAGVRLLIDVRELPLSRRKGFSKTALSASLAANDIAYVHLRDLGDPKPGREAARAGEFGKFRKIYSAHLRTKRAKDALVEAVRLATAKASCLLCFEREPRHCHRSVVADLIAEQTGLSVEHLMLKENRDDVRGKVRDRTGAHSGQGLAAAE